MEQINFDKNKWNQWLQAKGLGKRTLYLYNFYWDKFDFEKLSPDYLFDYLQKYPNNVSRAFLKNCLQWIRTNNFPQEIKVLVAGFELPKITGRKKTRLPDILTPEQVHSVSNAMNDERGKIMVLIAFYCGLRVSELCNIKPWDFKWDNWLKAPDKQGELKIIGKGNKQRNVLVPQFLMARTYQWIRNFVAKTQSRDAPLFHTGVRNFEDLLHDSSIKAIGRHVNPHLLRHSCGTWLKQKGFDLKDIASLLGHESINTTQIYTHISNEQLSEKYAKLFKD
jgi:site-specific recombinase XerD